MWLRVRRVSGVWFAYGAECGSARGCAPPATPRWIVAEKRRRAGVVRVPSFQPLSTKIRVELGVTASTDANDLVAHPGPVFVGEGTNQRGAHDAPPPVRRIRRRRGTQPATRAAPTLSAMCPRLGQLDCVCAAGACLGTVAGAPPLPASACLPTFPHARPYLPEGPCRLPPSIPWHRARTRQRDTVKLLREAAPAPPPLKPPRQLQLQGPRVSSMSNRPNAIDNANNKLPSRRVLGLGFRV